MKSTTPVNASDAFKNMVSMLIENGYHKFYEGNIATFPTAILIKGGDEWFLRQKSSGEIHLIRGTESLDR